MYRIVCLILILALLALAAIACDWDPTGGGDGWKPTQGSPMDGAYATETYGAEQWHAQLTALAETEEP